VVKTEIAKARRPWKYSLKNVPRVAVFFYPIQHSPVRRSIQARGNARLRTQANYSASRITKVFTITYFKLVGSSTAKVLQAVAILPWPASKD